MYDRLLGQRDRELGHVANVVGGFVRANLWYGDAESRFRPVEAAQQRAAVEFLHQNSFHPPASILDEDILGRIEATGAAQRVLRGQRGILESLLRPARIDRMAEQAARAAEGDDGYEPMELLADVRGGIWCELDTSPVSVDLYRRNLQRLHVELLTDAMQGEDAGASDLPALARGELTFLAGELERALTGAIERTTALHLADLDARIREALNPLLEGGDGVLRPIQASVTSPGSR